MIPFFVFSHPWSREYQNVCMMGMLSFFLFVVVVLLWGLLQLAPELYLIQYLSTHTWAVEISLELPPTSSMRVTNSQSLALGIATFSLVFIV